MLLTAASLYVSADARMGRTHGVLPEDVAIPSDAESIYLGERWVSALCAGCHGENLAGAVMFDDPVIGRIPAHNLTRGEGGDGAEYGDADRVRAIRHGVRQDGRALFVLPAEAYYHFSDRDLGTIIAYLKSLLPVRNDVGAISVTPMAKLLVAAGVFVNHFTAERIDHGGTRPESPAPGVTAEYGQYLNLAVGCESCHGVDLAGGTHPDPNGPPGPEITPGGVLRAWAEEDFLTAVRTRMSQWMPWSEPNGFLDEDLRALWPYLQSVPASK